jgi:UMF1 family MFS transporter
VLCLPYILLILASRKACPYSWDQPFIEGNETHRPHGFRYWSSILTPLGNEYWDIWEGYYNGTTMCRFDYDAIIAAGIYGDEFNAIVDPPEFWEERGNPDYGLPHVPVSSRSEQYFAEQDGDNIKCSEANKLAKSIRTLMGKDTELTADEVATLASNTEAFQDMGEAAKQCNDFPSRDYDLRKALPLDKQSNLDFRKELNDYVVCDYPEWDDPSQAIVFLPVRNVSQYATGKEGGRGEFDWGTENDGPVVFDIKYKADSPRKLPASKLGFNTTNPLCVATNAVTLADSSEDANPDVTVTIKNTEWNVGSTTIFIFEVDDDGVQVGPVLMDFTYTTYMMPFCPFGVDFMFFSNILPITYTSFVISLSVFFQAFFFMGFSGLGDFGPYRKMILLQTAIGGALATMANVLLGDDVDDYATSGYLFIVANLFFGASIVMYNAYLPFLTKSHPAFISKMAEFKANKAGGALKIGNQLKELLACYADLMDAISAKGFFFGYVSGTLMVIICLAVILMSGSSYYGLSVAVFLTGVWWLVFSLPMVFFLEKRPGPPLPVNNCVFALTFSFKRLMASVMCLKHIPETRRFVIGYFIYSDTYSTIASVGILFAVEELNMAMSNVIIMAAVCPFMAAVGIMALRSVQIKFDRTNKEMIIYCLGVLAFLMLYGMVGFSGVIGLVYQWEIWCLINVYGFVLGSIQSYTRTAYTDIVPPGQESEFFGIYEISDKGSSWCGPLVTGLLYQFTGSMRVGFIYLLFMCLLGMYLVWKTDFDEGAEACRRKEIQVRMEAVRNKLGVSKIAIQMNAKKRIGLKSSTASSNSSAASSVDSASSVEAPDSTQSKIDSEKSIIHKDVKEMQQTDMEDASTDALLHRGSILETGQKIMDVVPQRKSSFLSIRSQATSGGGGSSERSTRSSAESRSARRRPTALMSITEAGQIASLNPTSKVAPSN